MPCPRVRSLPCLRLRARFYRHDQLYDPLCCRDRYGGERKRERCVRQQNNSQPDDGTHDGLDVSGFSAGPGMLSITRTLECARRNQLPFGHVALRNEQTDQYHLDLTPLHRHDVTGVAFPALVRR
jgi:hypothetical protein